MNTQIKILYGYRGKPTRGHFLPAGIYVVGVNDLHGVSPQYLIDNGHAVLISGEVEASRPREAPVAFAQSNHQAVTMDEILKEVWSQVDATESAVDLALLHKITPEDVIGTGTDGRIIKADVEKALPE